jgi:hypothetical protein
MWQQQPQRPSVRKGKFYQWGQDIPSSLLTTASILGRWALFVHHFAPLFLSFLINQNFLIVILNEESVFHLQVSLCLCYNQFVIIIISSSLKVLLHLVLCGHNSPKNMLSFFNDKYFTHQKFLEIY